MDDIYTRSGATIPHHHHHPLTIPRPHTGAVINIAGKHRGSGQALSSEDTQHRRDALAVRAPSLALRYRQLDDRLLAQVDAKLKAQADRVIDSTTAHTTAEAERSNAHTTAEADRVVAALKEDKDPET